MRAALLAVARAALALTVAPAGAAEPAPVAIGQLPVKPEDAFRGPFCKAPGGPPALVIGMTHDPWTPFAWARRLVADLGNARRKGDDVADLGSDNDRFIWNPGDGNDAVDGQGGHNVLFFFGTNDAETLDLSVTGLAARLGITHAEAIDSLAVNTLAGHDTVDASGLAANTIQLIAD